MHPMPEPKEIAPSKGKTKWRWISLLRISLALAVLYIGGYFVLMDRGTPAVSDVPKSTGMTCSWSSFRWAQYLNGQPIYCIWNYIFAPLDRVYFEMFPSPFKLDIPTHFHSTPQKTQILDVTKPVKLTLTLPASEARLSVREFTLGIRAAIGGRAEVLYESHTWQIDGKNEMGRSGAYDATNFILEYRPINVRTGQILIEYEFRCVH